MMKGNDGDRGFHAPDLLAEVTHETRRPLGLARGYLSTILDEQLGPLTATQRDQLGRADRKIAEAQAELDNRLVLLSKLELNDGNGGASLHPIDLLADVQMAIDRAQARREQASGHLELLDAPPTVRARADSMLVSRVLDNLLENALLYSEGAPQVTVEVGVGENGRPFVRVVDAGIGMSPEVANKVFERGYRGDPSATRSGSGLGLWLSRRAAEQMQARLDLESTGPGRGSAFRLELEPDPGSAPMEGSTPGVSLLSPRRG